MAPYLPAWVHTLSHIQWQCYSCHYGLILLSFCPLDCNKHSAALKPACQQGWGNSALFRLGLCRPHVSKSNSLHLIVNRGRGDSTTDIFHLRMDFTPRSCINHMASLTGHSHAKSKKPTFWYIKIFSFLLKKGQCFTCIFICISISFGDNYLEPLSNRTSLLDGFALDISKYSLTSKTSANIMAGMSSIIFFHNFFFTAVVNEKRGFVELLYSVGALVFRASHSGAGLMGGRFRCLKYWVTCWGSSASTDLAKVSLGACQRKRAREHFTYSKTFKEWINRVWC